MTTFLHTLEDNDKGLSVGAYMKACDMIDNKKLDLSLPAENGYYALPPGKLATLTTYYEKQGPFVASLEAWPENVTYQRLGPEDLLQYRALFRSVGEGLLWESRLRTRDEELRAILSDPAIEAYSILKDKEAVGLLEIDFSQRGNAEIVYIGLMAEATGSGIGVALMNLALSRATHRKIERVWLHTCHFDSAQACQFYEKSGFKAYQLAVEIMDDPRLKGTLPRDAAPHIPLVSV